MDSACFSWNFKINHKLDYNKKLMIEVEEAENIILNNVNLNLKYDDLLIVIGEVGCGKTTFLYSIMDETTLNSGTK